MTYFFYCDSFNSNFEHLQAFYCYFDIDAARLRTKDSCKKLFFDSTTNNKNNCVKQLLHHLKKEEDDPLHKFALLFCQSIREKAKNDMKTVPEESSKRNNDNIQLIDESNNENSSSSQVSSTQNMPSKENIKKRCRSFYKREI